MTDRVKKILLFTSIGVLSLGAIGTGVGITIAGYQRDAVLNDLQSNSAIGPAGQGIRKRDYYLNLNGYWSEDNGAKFYVRVWQNSNNSNFIWILGEKKGNNFMFTIDNYYYDRIRFARCNPNQSAPSAFNSIDNASLVWQRTDNITITTSYSVSNTVKITSFGSGVDTNADCIWEAIN